MKPCARVCRLYWIQEGDKLIMKIRELYLRSFGKFSEKKVVFHDGINVIYGENESGKSTVHTFIKSMLFGFISP